jgi:hypothetical protein
MNPFVNVFTDTVDFDQVGVGRVHFVYRND